MHIERELVKCLYNRARSVAFQKDNLVEEEDHLLGALKQNGYPPPLTHHLSVLSHPYRLPSTSPDETPEEEKSPVMIIPYVTGVSKRIGSACSRYNIKVVFKSGPILC